MKTNFPVFVPYVPQNQTFSLNNNFPKSPNKFPVKEPMVKHKEIVNFSSNSSLSSNNLNKVKKRPHEYSTLRQTLNNKSDNMELLMNNNDKNKSSKLNNPLRHTLTVKPKTTVEV